MHTANSHENTFDLTATVLAVIIILMFRKALDVLLSLSGFGFRVEGEIRCSFSPLEQFLLQIQVTRNGGQENNHIYIIIAYTVYNKYI